MPRTRGPSPCRSRSRGRGRVRGKGGRKTDTIAPGSNTMILSASPAESVTMYAASEFTYKTSTCEDSTTAILIDQYGQTPDHFYLARSIKTMPIIKPQLFTDAMEFWNSVGLDKDVEFYFTVFRSNYILLIKQVKRRLDLEEVSGTTCQNPVFKTPKFKRQRTVSSNSTSSPRGTTPAKTTQERSRYDTSLGILTKKFVNLLQTVPNGILDLNQAANHLDVQKRRIYDITNVLEGIQLIQKKSKNNIQWVGDGTTDGSSLQQSSLQSELSDMEAKENHLDELIRSATLDLKMLTEDNDNRYAYVTYQDLRKINSFNDQTVITIKAPPETKLEVPNPQEALQMWLKSDGGEIEVFLCPDEDPIVELDSASSSTCDEVSQGDSGFRGDRSLKHMLISEDDDLGPMGRNLQLQTEDQHLDMQSFLNLEPPLSEDDYPYSLAAGEGIADLFDAYDLGF